MGTYLSPGIYTREVDFSFYVKQISTSSCGMVGVAERGPINKPVLVTSWEQFINKFGSYLQAGYLAYAARAFFDNGGSVLFVNRIAHLTDPTDRNTPVSYTHLDVYKRQEPGSLWRSGRRPSRTPFSSSARSNAASGPRLPAERRSSSWPRAPSRARAPARP